MMSLPIAIKCSSERMNNVPSEIAGEASVRSSRVFLARSVGEVPGANTNVSPPSFIR